MKKILIIPMLLSLIIFAFYHQESNKKEHVIKINKNIQEEIPIYNEIIEIYNNSKNELNSTNKKFKISVGSDINTTREKMITLNVKLENTQNIDTCNYFWYKEKNIIGIGSSVSHSFEKGEHKITVQVVCDKGDEANTSLWVRAYDYYTIRREHYNAYYGELEYTEIDILNYKDKYILMDDGIFSKYSYEYDEAGHTTQIKNEYYQYPNENETTQYEYDEAGNKIKEIILNAKGEIIYMTVNRYSEDGNLTSSKSGKDENSLIEDRYENESYVNISYTDSDDEESEMNIEEVKKYNDDAKLIYEEMNYGKIKFIYEYKYNEDVLVKDVTNIVSENKSQSRINIYNDKAEVVTVERKFTTAKNTSCHYETNYSYTDKGDIKSKVDVLLEGECPYLDDVKRIYNYDNQGNQKSTHAIVDGDEVNYITTLKVIKSYTNELEIY